jgi:hypothetical protein
LLSRKVTGSKPNEAIEFLFSLTYSSSYTVPLVFMYSAVHRNEYEKMSLENNTRQKLKAENLLQF